MATGKLVLPKLKRVKQWMTMSQCWYLFDAKWQNPFDAAEKIAHHLRGMHKPIYHPHSNIGDHVVVINSKEIAMPQNEWRYRMYSHHTLYAGGQTYTPLWEAHDSNPTTVLKKAVYREMSKDGLLRRPNQMCKLHLYPDTKVPPEILQNVSDQIRQLRRVPKKLDEYSKEETENFPKVFEWPQDYVIK